jgi:hypothetical protein
MTPSITRLSIECHYAEWRDLIISMFNVTMLSVIMLIVIMLNVVAPNAPDKKLMRLSRVR